MSWFIASIASAAITGVVAIIDSHLLSKRLLILKSLLLPIGFMHIGFGLVTLMLVPLPQGIGATPLIVAFTSGTIRSIGVLLMLKTMRSEEISRVVSVVHTFPIFVAIMAVPLLGEVLGLTEWLGIIMTVAGAVLISLRRGAGGQRARLRKSFTMLVASSLFIGIANTASKYSLGYISFWNMYSVNAFCFAIVFLLFSLRPRTLKDLKEMKQRNQILTLIGLNECVAIAGFMLSFLAIEQGPVSLVSAITSTRPGFVFVYSLTLSRIFPRILEERLSRSIIVIKIISIGLIIAGVFLLTT